MIIRCGWCSKDTGEKPPYDDQSYTDGICDSCLLKYFPHQYEKVMAIRGEACDETRETTVL